MNNYHNKTLPIIAQDDNNRTIVVNGLIRIFESIICFKNSYNKSQITKMAYSVQQIKTALEILPKTKYSGYYNYMDSSEKKELFNKIKEDGIFPILNSNGEFENHPKRETIKMLFDTFLEWYEDSHAEILYMNKKPDSNAVKDALLENETVLFQTDHNDLGRHSGIVISDSCIYEYEIQKGLFSYDYAIGEGACYYYFANHVDYSDSRINFYNRNGEKFGSVYVWNGVKGQELARVLNRICQLPENAQPCDLLDNDDVEGAKTAAKALIWCRPNDGWSHFQMAETLVAEIRKEKEKNSLNDEEINLLMEKEEEAKKEYEKAIDLFDKKDDEDRYFISQSQFNIAGIEYRLNRLEQARCYLIQGLEGYEEDDKDEMWEILCEFEDDLKETWDVYTSKVAFKDRKFIMPIRDKEIGGCVAKGVSVFRQSNIPSCIIFPIGHPVANQLYIGHPYRPSLYVPYEQSEELFFLDKVHEFRYLLECLGAEEISITSIKGKDVSEFSDSNNRYAVDGEIKRFSAGVEVNTQYKNQNDSSSHSHRSMMVKLDPLQRPFLPDGLIWYNEMPQWQRLVQSRLHGNLLEYSEFVSTAETKFTSSSEITDIKASAEYLWVKAQAKVSECLEKQFKESTETQWKVDVKFRSMKDFEDQMIDAIENEEIEPLNQIEGSKEEQDYAEEVKFCLEDDGVIDDSERRHLERKRIKFGISQKRAAEIENSLLQSQLTEDEQEYLETVKEELVGGKIPEASRRLLERLRKRMDVSDERAKEIEIMAMKR